ncbi:MAG TPA: hypothetical protein VF846_12530, partial [Thermoanaerobaculia bacterium]
MCGRVKAVLFLLLLSSSLSADCNWTPRTSAQFRTTALDLSIDGNFVWLATGYGVQLLEGARVVDALALPGNTRVIHADGNGFAYVGSGARIYVLQRNGREITLVRSVAASAVVNDIAIVSSYLFAATATGIDHFNLFDPANPQKSNIVLTTSAPNVTSLAATNTTLYAADGDATVEMFGISTPSLPQQIGSLEAMPRASAVHAGGDGFIYVSDRFGQSTDVFSGTARIASLPIGANSFASSPARAHFVAGPDRTIRALDFTSTDRRIELFEAQFAPTDGTDNVIHAMARSGNTIYVAAGDIGLVTIDAAAIAKPYPLAGYVSGATSSVATDGNKAWLGDAAGKITEYTIDPNGIALTAVRNWNDAAGSTLRDVRNNGLLTTNGSIATLWALVSATPTVAGSVTFADAIVDAVAADAYLVALLANGDVYTTTSLQQPAKVNVPRMSLLARAGSAIVMAEVREDDGKTVLHYWPTGDLATESRKFTIDGAAFGNIALDATRAAVVTFTGINVIDLQSGAVRTIASSIPRQLAFAGSDLLVLDARSVLVYNDARTLVRRQTLPADAVALDVSGTVAVLATNEGVAAVSRTTAVPHAVARFANHYYSKVVTGGDHVYLFGKEGVDVFTAASSSPLRYVTGIRTAGTIDVAATETHLYTLSGNGTVSAWSPFGALLGQRDIETSEDSQPLSIATARGAVWVSLVTGCATGQCARKTVIVDPSTLLVTATMTGALRDLAVSGTRGYALFDHPNEMRVLDLTSPLQPSLRIAAARPATATS